MHGSGMLASSGECRLSTQGRALPPRGGWVSGVRYRVSAVGRWLVASRMVARFDRN